MVHGYGQCLNLATLPVPTEPVLETPQVYLYPWQSLAGTVSSPSSVSTATVSDLKKESDGKNLHGRVQRQVIQR